MSRNATASWSGYSHQGKVGFLIALRKINSMAVDADLSLYRLEYETQEDVKLLEGVNTIEVHQVKAYGNGSTKGSYTSALLAFEVCLGSNFLHSICEITNWADLLPAENPHNVQRYPYALNALFCSLNDIGNYIDSEIQTVLQNRNHPECNNQGWRNQVYNALLALLDERIREEHANGNTNTYNVGITLNETLDILNTNPPGYQSKLFAIRRGCMESYLELIEIFNGLAVPLSQAVEDAIKSKIEHAYTLSDHDFERFLINLSPSSSYGKKLSEQVTTDAFFSQQNFTAIFIQTIMDVTARELQYDQKVIPHFSKGEKYILTCIRDNNEVTIRQAARNILQNNSVDFSEYEVDYIINESQSGQLGELAGKFNDIDETKFINPKAMQFIPKQNAIGILNTP
jgi:hypothetical protein